MSVLGYVSFRGRGDGDYGKELCSVGCVVAVVACRN